MTGSMEELLSLSPEKIARMPYCDLLESGINISMLLTEAEAKHQAGGDQSLESELSRMEDVFIKELASRSNTEVAAYLWLKQLNIYWGIDCSQYSASSSEAPDDEENSGGESEATSFRSVAWSS